MRIHDLGTTTQYEGVTWTGNGFQEPDAQILWQRLPVRFRKVARAEVGTGNAVISILENRERSIVVLCLQKGTLTNIEESEDTKIHRSHTMGNYCYDGTSVTYEDLETGGFLAFENPDYEEDTY